MAAICGRHAVPITSTINSDLDNQPSQIYDFPSCSSIPPLLLVHRLTIPICTITFCLALLQATHILPATYACHNLLARFASTPAPVIPITLITATTLASYDFAACAGLGATVGIDQLSDNDAKC
jgi:hypothetical protein